MTKRSTEVAEPGDFDMDDPFPRLGYRDRDLDEPLMIYAASTIGIVAIYFVAYTFMIDPSPMWVTIENHVVRSRDPNYRVLSRLSGWLFAPAHTVDFLIRTSFWFEADEDRLLAEDNEHRGYVRLFQQVCSFGGEGGWTTELISVDLSNSDVTDNDLSGFNGVEPIHYISLRNTRISDSGLVRLARLRGLQYIDVRGTSVSLETARTLESTIPGIHINTDYGYAK